MLRWWAGMAEDDQPVGVPGVVRVNPDSCGERVCRWCVYGFRRISAFAAECVADSGCGMMRSVGVWVVLVFAVAAIAGAVEFAARAQETAANTNFAEAQNATDMSVAMLEQERGLDGFAASGRPAELQPYFAGEGRFSTDLSDAFKVSSNDSLELALVRQQRAIERKWQTSTALELAQAESRHPGAPVPADSKSDRLITSFLVLNASYEARLAVNRHKEESRAALVPLWLIGGLSGLFGLAGWVYLGRVRRTRAQVAQREQDARSREFELSAMQGRFAEALQVSESQSEAHAVIAHYLQDAIPGSEVVVLNRNNSADRIESTMPLPEGHPLGAALEGSTPRSCLAVRLNRQYEQQHGANEVLRCDICGGLPTASTCQPLLVGGEVIGSVLLAHAEPFSAEGHRLLVDSVSQAAPVLANLRNLALAENRAATDVLTGLPNRRSVDDWLKRMLAQAARTVSPFSVVLLDLDHFKQINDTCGHDRGDEVLAAFGALLRNELRESDLGGRTGGEEFALLLPDTDRNGAVQLADKIRHALHQIRIKGVDGPITASFGVASFPDDAADAGTLLRTADRALYSAKRQGRDRIETATTTPLRAAPELPPSLSTRRLTIS
jgi:diguanylate cyclase (GGDEF)-like protein